MCLLFLANKLLHRRQTSFFRSWRNHLYFTNQKCKECQHLLRCLEFVISRNIWFTYKCNFSYKNRFLITSPYLELKSDFKKSRDRSKSFTLFPYSHTLFWAWKQFTLQKSDLPLTKSKTVLWNKCYVNVYFKHFLFYNGLISFYCIGLMEVEKKNFLHVRF